MSAVYLETSALLTWLFDESQAPEICARVAEAEAVVTSALTILEAERAFVRAVSEGILREAGAQRLRGILARHRAAWILMTVGDEVLDRAGRGFPVETVRSLDAIHLASALAFVKALPDLKMLTLDRRVADNAAALGLDERH